MKGITMFITRITNEKIIFSDGSYIDFDHAEDCCERNYADFSIITPQDRKRHFENVDIRAKEEGFLLCLDNYKIWIPCYSEQNGYYTTELDIFYQDKYNDLIKEINLDAQLVDC